MNDFYVQFWIIITKEGIVVLAYCVGCMVGLGECCFYIASVFFYLEVWIRLNGKFVCIQVKCIWFLFFVVKLEYVRVKDINFVSVKKFKSDFDKLIEFVNFLSIELSFVVQIFEFIFVENKLVLKLLFLDELQEFYKLLSECSVKLVCFSLIYLYFELFIFIIRDIKFILDLYEKKYFDLFYFELFQECYKVDLKLFEE